MVLYVPALALRVLEEPALLRLLRASHVRLAVQQRRELHQVSVGVRARVLVHAQLRVHQVEVRGLRRLRLLNQLDRLVVVLVRGRGSSRRNAAVHLVPNRGVLLPVRSQLLLRRLPFVRDGRTRRRARRRGRLGARTTSLPLAHRLLRRLRLADSFLDLRRVRVEVHRSQLVVAHDFIRVHLV